MSSVASGFVGRFNQAHRFEHSGLVNRVSVATCQSRQRGLVLRPAPSVTHAPTTAPWSARRPIRSPSVTHRFETCSIMGMMSPSSSKQLRTSENRENPVGQRLGPSWRKSDGAASAGETGDGRAYPDSVVGQPMSIARVGTERDRKISNWSWSSARSFVFGRCFTQNDRCEPPSVTLLVRDDLFDDVQQVCEPELDLLEHFADAVCGRCVIATVGGRGRLASPRRSCSRQTRTSMQRQQWLCLRRSARRSREMEGRWFGANAMPIGVVRELRRFRPQLQYLASCRSHLP